LPAPAFDQALPALRSRLRACPATGWLLQSSTLPAIAAPRRAAVTRETGRLPSSEMPRIACIAFAAFQSLGRMPLITYSPKPMLPPAELPDGIRSENLA
jgi:hypothetical protein